MNVVDMVSATMPKTDVDDVLAAIETIKTKMSFLIDLSPEQRRTRVKAGEKGQTFVNRAHRVATDNPKILPGTFDKAEYDRDVNLFEALLTIAGPLNQLTEKVNDTQLEVGSEAYVASLLVYQYAQTAGMGQGLDGVLDELGQRFARKSHAKTPVMAQ